MSSNSTQSELSEEELRELIPQLQQLTDKYKRAERVQKALFDISELASSVSNLNHLYTSIHEIIGDFMNADNFYVAFYDPESNIVDFSHFVDEFDEQTVRQLPAESLMDGMTGYILKSGNHLFYKRDEEHKFAEELGLSLSALPLMSYAAFHLSAAAKLLGLWLCKLTMKVCTIRKKT